MRRICTNDARWFYRFGTFMHRGVWLLETLTTAYFCDCWGQDIGVFWWNYRQCRANLVHIWFHLGVHCHSVCFGDVDDRIHSPHQFWNQLWLGI